MQSQRVLSIVALLTCFFELLPSAVPSVFGADAVFDQVTQLFAAVDGPSGKSSTNEQAYLRLQKLKPSDAGSDAAHYAYLLGLVQLRKQREASVYASEVIEHHPNDAPARLLRARLLLREKKFAEVFVELEAAGKLLSEQVKKDSFDANTEASCRTLGLMFGYLEGPGKPLVKATLGNGVKQHVLANFSSAAHSAFTEQYAAVLEEQQELITKGEVALKVLQAKHREDSEAAAIRKARLEAEKSAARGKQQAEIERLTKNWDSLKADYDKLVTSFLNMQAFQTLLANRRAQLAGQRSRALPREPRRDKNGNVSAADRAEYDRARRHYEELTRQITPQINGIEQQMLIGTAALRQVSSQGLVTQDNLLRTQAEGAKLGVAFALQEKAFAKQDAILNNKDPAKKMPSTASSKQMEQSFALYDNFNFALEKQRLLDAIRPVQN